MELPERYELILAFAAATGGVPAGGLADGGHRHGRGHRHGSGD
jgi:hypothetical protein